MLMGNMQAAAAVLGAAAAWLQALRQHSEQQLDGAGRASLTGSSMNADTAGMPGLAGNRAFQGEVSLEGLHVILRRFEGRTSKARTA